MILSLEHIDQRFSGLVLLIILNTLVFLQGFSQDSSNQFGARKSNVGSVLSDGDWYKIAVTEEGVFRIDYEFLRSMGIDPSKVDPSTIRIYGNGGKMLPQSNSEFRYDGLQENSVFEISGNTSFSPGDQIIFYGQGPDECKIQMDSGEVKLQYENNIYSDTTYYFLTYGSHTGKRIASKQHLGLDHPKINSFLDFRVYETDQFNLVNSGRFWYGEKFDLVNTQEFEFKIPGIRSNSVIRIKSVVLGKSSVNSTFQLNVNGITAGTHEISKITDGTYALKGRVSSEVFEINSSLLSMPDEMLRVGLTYNKPFDDSRSVGYLDYFNIVFERDLELYGPYTFFRSEKAVDNPDVTYEVQVSDSDVKVWDLTDGLNPVNVDINISGNKMMFGAEGGEIAEYVVFNPGDLPVPVFVEEIPNQDLFQSSVPDMLIVTHPEFIHAAQRLADFRESHDGLNVIVVTPKQVYNDFSSGSQDVTAIRDYVRYLYDLNPGDGLKYLLLFGRGSFDYKDKLDYNTNFVPIYQSYNSLHPIYSYASDDYFAFLEEDEGNWQEDDATYHTMDIGVGRIPVITPEEAGAVVDKLITYDTHSKSFGNWRNEIVFVADDGDGEDGIIHSRQADNLATYVDSVFTNFNVNKIYLDAFPQESTPNKQIAPEVNQAINDAIQQGALIMNFTGHGAESAWTAETILDIITINNWDNLYRLPLLVTATCEFGRNDNPRQRSGAEFAIVNSNGGAIGLVTTSRPVFSNPNYELNLDFYSNVFNKYEGRYQSLGDVFRKTKNLNSRVVTRNFILLGDPSIKLAYPDNEVHITHVNESVVDETDTLSALKKVSIKGNVTVEPGGNGTGFNGVLTTTVFDKPVMTQTLGTDDPIMKLEERQVIFRGDASIKNGEFEFEFIIPRNITYSYGDGKISLYAISDNYTSDASGSSNNIIIGGSESGDYVDTQAPEIQLFLNDTTFTFGGTVGNNPILVAKIFDENGINLGGDNLGQGIMIILDGESEIVISDFYKADIDSYQSGTVRYPFSELSEGPHNLVLKVRDTYNNSSEAYIEFVVTDDGSLVIQNLINYPNPFRDETLISFEHNRSGEDLELGVEIYDSYGQLVRKTSGYIKHSEFRINSIKWDGRNSNGEKMRSGIYIYRVFVRSLRDGAKNYGYDKMVIIN